VAAPVRALSYPLAVLIILVVPLLAVAAGAGLLRWARWLLTTGRAVGLIGLALTAGLAVNLFVPRTCADESRSAIGQPEVNRPAISLVVGDGPCFRSALAQAQLTALAGLSSSVVVSLRRRAARPAPPAREPAATR
jgi:hypothetical protein